MPTIINFNEAVIAFYLNRKADNDLGEIERRSPAALRDVLLLKLASGDLQKDTPALEKIFNNTRKFEDLARAIMNGGIDKFRPVQYFMQGRTSEPSDDTIILLSIFINFQPRPYAAWREKELEEVENAVSGNEKTQESKASNPGEEMPKGDNNTSGEPTGVPKEMTSEVSTNPNPLIGVAPTKTKDADTKITLGTNSEGEQNKKVVLTRHPVWKLKDKKSLSILSTALVLTLLMAFYTWPDKQCMYWNGENYVAIDCNDVNPQLNIMALNSEKLRHFKRITQTDTLTKNHVNKVWYSKINNEVEFFTYPGLHPTHQHRSLKAATQYILESYAICKNKEGAID
ncbi:hypothetical protein M8998_06745 [Sphingobacterium sp. lm-10]|uniref:hypothetical protein n=1 Tax=Sphingobacterium sp. lm-10 TaxID=2944904 RepID=UPI002021BD06|nr:hypothetical protein [Sphingobacterium sp. lm-10]MCL7987632.1 hypothetical protein [Sphingobacterium sp. lm-10]